MTHPALDSILVALDDRLARLSSDRFASYRVPGLWVDPAGLPAEREVTPETFFVERIVRILAEPAQPLVQGDGAPSAGSAGDWGRYAIAYNLFGRAGAAWDHDGDGRVAAGLNAAGWRETGTFLKAIALLPFIRSLGCNVIHLLPITAIGRDGNKGNLGSPFAIRDPYVLDEGQSEPALGVGADTEFAAFVEAAHHLGLRVIVEFVFRTAAKDAAWAAEHPDWFYWIRANIPDRVAGAAGSEGGEDAYGAPSWTRAELEQIYQQVGVVDFNNLPAPHAAFQRMFLPPPRPEDMRLIDGAWRATVRDPETGEPIEARIPGAFADWTPDSDQPPWNDVTYLRLYDHPDFNYIAYNTVRMYDTRLGRPENAVMSLWDRIVEVSPYYQRHFGIDGIMIDMGHALPPPLKQRLVAAAREASPDFALWAEDFDLKPTSRAEGYNVCVGPFMQTVREAGKLRAWLETLSQTGVPVPFMAMSENHNVPRAVTWPGGLRYACYAQTVGAFLPGVPYVHGGLEVAEDRPINTGFDFSDAQLAALPTEVLYLFSARAYSWTRSPNLVEPLRRLHTTRQRYARLLSDPSAASLAPLDAGNPAVVAFWRGPAGGMRLLVLANGDMAAAQTATLRMQPGLPHLVDALAGRRAAPDGEGRLIVELAPGEVLAFPAP